MASAIHNNLTKKVVSFLAKRLTAKAGTFIKRGGLSVEFPDGSTANLGNPSDQLSANLKIHDERFYRRLLFDGETGFSEAYVDGLWTSDDLVSLYELAILNRGHVSPNYSWLSRLSRLRNRHFHLARRNTPSTSKDNIHAHYDLGNDFFRLFLDETMTYSCAVFSSEGESLADAQRNKYLRICERAGLIPEDHVLEIGSGWGGFAIFAAQNYGSKVTTITISQEQFDQTRKLVQELNLSSLIDVQLCDYRDVSGEYDKIVSIEMFEAVGYEYFQTFFRKCDAVLRHGGRMCMQVITIPNRSFAAHRDGVNWLQKYIFPGGLLPSLAEMERSLSSTSLLLTHAEEIGAHYVPTLRRWRERFLANHNAVRDLGFDDKFIRMWECYLASCEAAFRARSIGDVQIVFEKPSFT